MTSCRARPGLPSVPWDRMRTHGELRQLQVRGHISPSEDCVLSVDGVDGLHHSKKGLGESFGPGNGVNLNPQCEKVSHFTHSNQ